MFSLPIKIVGTKTRRNMHYFVVLFVLVISIIISSSTTLKNFCIRTVTPGEVLNSFWSDSELYSRAVVTNEEIIDVPTIVYGCGNEFSEILAICKVKTLENEKIKIEWTTPSETDIRREETLKFTHADEYESSLKIRNATYNDKGNYKCNVIFQHDKVNTVERIIKVKPRLGVEPVDQEEDKIKLKVIINSRNSAMFHEWLRVDPQFDYITSINGYNNYQVDFKKNDITLTINNFTENEDENDYYIFRDLDTLAFIEFNITKTTGGYNVYYSAKNECEPNNKFIPDFKFYAFIPAISQTPKKSTQGKPSC
ncbi:uncharacterized protein LOC117179997 [Belonocnema kinseyi]|uniref:uncharacterized protein LOC117179997 n=1 Tax=Belonocnema kinseyi TaxID=2817044 RepID=UPI00143DF60A|nr:uncharacterized protein LOC117179997 [Belonocnema kinseyi]